MIAQFTLGLRRYTTGPANNRGNVTRSYADAVPIVAYSIGPAYQQEEGGRLVSTGLVVGLPQSYGITAKDRVVIDGEEWSVEGDLVNSNRGPFGYAPGYVMTVKRVTD